MFYCAMVGDKLQFVDLCENCLPRDMVTLEKIRPEDPRISVIHNNEHEDKQ